MKKQKAIAALLATSGVGIVAAAIATPLVIMNQPKSSDEVLKTPGLAGTSADTRKDTSGVFSHKTKQIRTIDLKKATVGDATIETLDQSTGGLILNQLWDQIKPKLEEIIAHRDQAISQGLLEDVEVPENVGITNLKVDFNYGNTTSGKLDNLSNVYLNLYSKDDGQTILLGLYSDEVNIYFEITLGKNVDYRVIYKVLVNELNKIIANQDIINNDQLNSPVVEYAGDVEGVEQFFVGLEKLRKEAKSNLSNINDWIAYKVKVVDYMRQYSLNNGNLDIMAQDEADMENYLIKFSFYDTKKLGYYQNDNNTIKFDTSRDHHYIFYDFVDNKILRNRLDAYTLLNKDANHQFVSTKELLAQNYFSHKK